MLALLRFAINSSIFVDHNEFLDELPLGVMLGQTVKQNITFDKKIKTNK